MSAITTAWPRALNQTVNQDQASQTSRGADATTELAAVPRPVVASKCHESGCINGQCSPSESVSAPHEGRSTGAKTSR